MLAAAEEVELVLEEGAGVAIAALAVVPALDGGPLEGAEVEAVELLGGWGVTLSRKSLSLSMPPRM